MHQEIAAVLNQQINMELFSAYLYLDISNFYNDRKLDGFSSWFAIQTQEERDHAMLMIRYLHDNDASVELREIAAPSRDYSDFKAPLQAALAHEKAVTRAIDSIYGLALELRDYRAMQFLDWFVKEQGEEEKNVGDLVDKFDLYGMDPKSLYLLNSELRTRVYAPPTLVL